MQASRNRKLATGYEHYIFSYGNLEGRNKLMFIDGRDNLHFTLVFKDNINVADLHKTDHRTGYEPSAYNTCLP